MSRHRFANILHTAVGCYHWSRQSAWYYIDRNIVFDSRNTVVVEPCVAGPLQAIFYKIVSTPSYSKRDTCGKEQTYHTATLGDASLDSSSSIIKVARNSKKLNSLFQTSGPPTPSPIDMDSRHAGAWWAMQFCYRILYWLLPHAFPCASINCAPDTTVTEANPTLPETPIPVSLPIFNTSSDPASMVSIILISLIAMIDCCSLRMCHFQPPIPNAPSSMVPNMCTCTSRQWLRPIM